MRHQLTFSRIWCDLDKKKYKKAIFTTGVMFTIRHEERGLEYQLYS